MKPQQRSFYQVWKVGTFGVPLDPADETPYDTAHEAIEMLQHPDFVGMSLAVYHVVLIPVEIVHLGGDRP